MLINFNKYKEQYHFSVNFYSIFLIITAIPDILHISSSLIILPFWGIKVLLATWIISKDKRYSYSFSRIEILYFILVFIYIANLFADIFIFPSAVLGSQHGTMDFVGFLIGILLALSFRYDPAFHSEKSFKFFVITLSIGLIIAYFTAIPAKLYDEFNSRLDANSTINTIFYGIIGCALSITSIYGFVNYKKWLIKILFIIAFIIGFVSIAKAGSRSPVAVLILVTTFFLMARLGSMKGFIILFVLFCMVIIFLNPIIDLVHSMGSSLADRLTSSIKENDTSGRDLIWKNVLNIIEGSPILGAYYLVPSGIGVGGYPHNYILEAFMTTGLLGGIPFLFLVIFSLRKAFKLIKMRHPATWIVILYIQIIFYSMFSTGLYTGEDFWMLLFFMLSLKIDKAEPANNLPLSTQSSQKMSVFIQ